MGLKRGMTHYPYVRAALDQAGIPFTMTRRDGIIVPMEPWQCRITDEEGCLCIRVCVMAAIPSILFLDDALLVHCNRASLESGFSFYMEQRKISVRCVFPAAIAERNLGQLALDCLKDLSGRLPAFLQELTLCIESTGDE